MNLESSMKFSNCLEETADTPCLGFTRSGASHSAFLRELWKTSPRRLAKMRAGSSHPLLRLLRRFCPFRFSKQTSDDEASAEIDAGHPQPFLAKFNSAKNTYGSLVVVPTFGRLLVRSIIVIVVESIVVPVTEQK